MPKALCEKPFRAKDDPATSRHEAIATEEFCLVDKKGNVRAALGLNGDGQARLLLFDNNEKLRLSFYVEDDQPGIELLDTNEKTRAALGLGPHGQPSLLFLDKDEKVHASLEMGKDGRPGLDLYDAHGELRASFSLFRDDDLPNLALVDKDGQHHRLNKSAERSDPYPLLALFDKGGDISDMLGGECDEGSA